MLLAALPLALFAGSARAVLIDHFVDPLVGDEVSTAIVGSVETHYDDTADFVDDFLGDERDVILTKVGGFGGVKQQVNVAPSLLTLSVDELTTGELLVEWDGAGEGDGVLAFGLTEDFSAETGWEFSAKTDQDCTYTLRFYTGAGSYFTKDFAVLDGGGPFVYTAAKGAFTNVGGADWSDIRAVTLKMVGPESFDTSIDYLRQTPNIPEPGTLALLSGGLALIVRRRKRK